MKRRYTVILERAEEGGYHVYCPALPGCHSEGESVDEALANVTEAIELYLESLRAHGEPIPEEPLIFVAAAEIETDVPVAVGQG